MIVVRRIQPRMSAFEAPTYGRLLRQTAEARMRRVCYLSDPLPLETVSQFGNASPSTSLSFRPQGEILDPSHSFGMTTRSATHCDTVLLGEGRGEETTILSRRERRLGSILSQKR